MILVDANLLIYTYSTNLPQHRAAREWLETRLNDTPRVGLPRPCLLAFVRLVSNPRIFDRPVPVTEAWRQVEEWLSLESVWVPEPSRHHEEILGDLLKQVGEKANLVPDAHLAAIAIGHGLTLCSADGDFARFRGLHWRNPLA